MTLHSASAQVVLTSQYAVGNFCLSNLPRGAVTKALGMEMNGVLWDRFNVDLHSRTSGARLTVYDAPVDWENFPAVDCAHPPAGRRVVLAGTINGGHLGLFHAQDPKGGARVQIDPDSIRLELGHVTVDAQPVLGGTVSFKDRRVWLYNKERISIQSGSGATGGVVTEVTDVEIRDLKLRLAENGEPVKVTVGVTGKNVKFLLDLSKGGLSLYEGTLWAEHPSFPPAAVQLAGLTLDAARLAASRLELKGDHTRALATFSDAAVSAPKVSHGPVPVVQIDLQEPLAARLITASVPVSATEAVLKDVRLEGIVGRGDLKLISPEGKTLLAGSGTLNLQWMTDGALLGGASLASATCPELAQVIPGATLPLLDLSLQGEKSALTVAGTGALPAVQIGEMAVKSLAAAMKTLSFGPAQVGATLALPFHFKAPPLPGGTVDFATGDAKVAVSGQVQKLELSGTVTLGSGPASLVIEPGGLDLGVTAAAAVTPVLFGAKPSFAKAEAHVLAKTRILVSREKTAGSLLVESAGVVLPDPELYFEQGGVRLNVPLKTEAAVAFDVDLGTGAWSLDRGSLAVDGIKVKTIGETPLTLDLMQVEHAELTLDHLVINALPGRITGTGSGLSLSAAKLSHGGNPRLSGSLGKPLTIKSFEAVATQRDGKLVIDDVKGKDFRLTATNLEYVSADGFRAQGAATVRAAGFSRESVDGLVLDIPQGEATVEGANNGRAALSGLHVEAGGRKDELSGNARLHLSTVGLNLSLPASLDSGCAAMKLRARADLGDIDVSAQIKQGALNGEATIDEAAVRVREDEHFHCEFDRNHHIKDEWVLFSVPCIDGWSVKMCDVKAGPIDATIHWTIDIRYFEAAAAVHHTVVRLDGERGVKACGGTLHDLQGPFIAGAYVPTFNNNIPFISDVINGIILATGYGFESTLVNTVGTAASLTNLFHRPELLGGC